MTPEHTFLYSIEEEPDQDGLRLIFADWLEDNGQPERAEFLRIQVALAGLDLADPRRAELTARERSLLTQHQTTWLGSVWSERLANVRFRRGFVHEVTIHPRSFHETTDDFFRRFPFVRQLRFYEVSGRARGLLDFYHEPKGYSTELFRSPHFARLEALALRDNRVGDEAVLALAGSPHVAGLKSLDLSSNQISDVGVTALLASPYLAHLTELDLGGNPVSASAREALRFRFGEQVSFESREDFRRTEPSEVRLGDILLQAVILDESRVGTREQIIEESAC